MTLSPAERTDALNIGLMLLSCVVAMVMPFEVFLFSYAVLGPLHYLTEISWLHDKQYYTRSRWDSLWLLLIGLLTTLAFFNRIYNWEYDLPLHFSIKLTYVAFLSALIMVLVKKPFYKIAGIALVIVTCSLSENFLSFFAIFLPTLVHVYLFTALFMLYGALKSKSRLGIAAVAVLLLCPAILWFVAPGWHPFATTIYGQASYVADVGDQDAPLPIGFYTLHQGTMSRFFGVLAPAQDMKQWMKQIFESRTGILLGRFIAFAYTYHYLNWFSKTRVIQWHKVPKVRFAVVLVIWAGSLALYFYNYALGLQWLFFLSFMHVLLEFPLNYTSIIGIGRHLYGKLARPRSQIA